MVKHAKKGGDKMTIKDKRLEEQLSVAELRLYNGKEDEKDSSILLSKVFIARDKNTAFDVFGRGECSVYEMHDGVYYPATEMTSDNLNIGDIFCVIEKDLHIKTDLVEYMIDSPDFFYQRLPYIEERFRLFSKGENSSYLLPLLKQYQNKIRRDSENILSLKNILANRSELLKEGKEENGVSKIKTNQC